MARVLDEIKNTYMCIEKNQKGYHTYVCINNNNLWTTGIQYFSALILV